jgi:histidyl-tRNA synthetase
MACLNFFSGFNREDPHHAGRLERLRAFLEGNEAGQRAVTELEEIVRLADSRPAPGKVLIDASLARGLSYYTGAIMEIAVPDLPGSLGGGGRYDNLIGMFLGRDVPACGFSLGLERIIVVMTERRMFPEALVNRSADVMVSMWSEDSRGDALALAADLRRDGVRTELYPEADKLGKQFKYASSRRFPFVAVVGDDERAQNAVTVKNMRSGSQETMPRPAVADYVRRQLAAAVKDVS